MRLKRYTNISDYVIENVQNRLLEDLEREIERLMRENDIKNISKSV
jgi:hypothetical protein